MKEKDKKQIKLHLQLRYLQQIDCIHFERCVEERQQQARVNARLFNVQVLQALYEPIRDFTDSPTRHQLGILHHKPATRPLTMVKINGGKKRRDALTTTMTITTVLMEFFSGRKKSELQR